MVKDLEVRKARRVVFDMVFGRPASVTIAASAIEPAALKMARRNQTAASWVTALAITTTLGLALFARGASVSRMITTSLFLLITAGTVAVPRFLAARRLRRIAARAITDLDVHWQLVGQMITASDAECEFEVSAGVAKELRAEPLALPAATLVRRNPAESVRPPDNSDKRSK